MNYPICSNCRSTKVEIYLAACKDYIRGDRFNVYRCRECEICFTDVRDVDVANHYGESYYSNEESKFRGAFNRAFNSIQKARAKRILRLYAPTTVLDMGCGQANVITELAKNGVKTLGVEANASGKWLLNKKGIEVISDEEFTARHTNGQIPRQDVIVMWHVIEHITQLQDNLAILKSTLREDGALIISCPNISSLQAKLFKSFWFHLDVPRHVFHFDSDSLRKNLSSSGFDIESECAGDISQNLYGWFQSLANSISGGCDNSFYQLTQGILPKSRSGRVKLLVQCLASPLWLSFGVLGYLIESIIGKHGSITIVARLKTDS